MVSFEFMLILWPEWLWLCSTSVLVETRIWERKTEWTAPEVWRWESCSGTQCPQRSPEGFLPADGIVRRWDPDTDPSCPSWPPQSGTAEPAGFSSAQKPHKHSQQGNKRMQTAALLQRSQHMMMFYDSIF